MEEYVIGFVDKDSLTEIEIVSDITGLTIKEIKSITNIKIVKF